MAELPEDTITPADLAQWFQLKEQLGKVKAAEALLRSRIYKFFFKTPKEGTNNHPLNDGTGAVLKAVRVIDRKVELGSLDALRTAQSKAIEDNKAGAPMPNIPLLNFDKLIKWTPELVTKEYRELTEAERHYFDQCLIIKDGSPQVSIEIPKKAAG